MYYLTVLLSQSVVCECVKTILVPNNSWGGDGCIGCDIGRERVQCCMLPSPDAGIVSARFCEGEDAPKCPNGRRFRSHLSLRQKLLPVESTSPVVQLKPALKAPVSRSPASIIYYILYQTILYSNILYYTITDYNTL